MKANPAYAHRGILGWNGHVSHNLGHGAVEVGVRAGKVGNAGEEAQGLAHDVDGNRRVQRRQVAVALYLVDQFGRNALVVLKRGSAANHAMADGRRGREVAGMERVGHQLEGNGAVGQGRGLIDDLFALCVLDPELAQIGANAVDCPLVELGPLAVAGFIDRKLDRGRTAVQYQYRQRGHE